MSSDAKQLVEQIAAEADATADEPMPAGALATKPNKSVPVAVRLAPEDVAAIAALARPVGRAHVLAAARLDSDRFHR